MSSLARALIKSEKIKTTEAKAKELRPMIEKMITVAKKNSIFSRRILTAKLSGNNDLIAKKLIDEISPKYKERAGGYTRIIKLPFRKSDGSPMAQIEFV